MNGVSLFAAAALILAGTGNPARSSSDDWVPVQGTSLEIQAGSPLDFSRYLEAGPAGRQGPIGIDRSGRLNWSSGDGRPTAFHCGTVVWTPATGGYPPKDELDRYVEQFKRRGYNVIRFHYVDLALMEGRKEHFDFDPEQIDRFFYFLSRLKEAGIYWIIDVMTSGNGAVGNIFPHRWKNEYDLKFRVYFDPFAQSHWRRMVDDLLTRVNPYTGLSLIADPAFIIAILVNENDIERLLEDAKPERLSRVRRAFATWLAGTYKTEAALAAAWGMPSASLPTFQGAQIPDQTASGPQQLDFQRFLFELKLETAEWMSEYLKGKGFRGLITNYHVAWTINSHLLRSRLPVVDQHSYTDHPEGETKILQQSSLSNTLRYAQFLAVTRWLGKPFIVSEYGHSYWNRYRREAGLVVPALGRFQGWDLICNFGSSSVELRYGESARRKRTLYPFFTMGLDPVARAGETLAFLLFARGDVAEGRTTVGFGLDDIVATTEAMPRDLSRISLLTKVGNFRGRAPAGVIPFEVDGRREGPAGRLGLTGDRFDMLLKTLRRDGTVPADNVTDPGRGVYQTETGEFTLDQGRGHVRVRTPRTEAASYNQSVSDLTIGRLVVRSGSDPALVAVSALDDRPLGDSESILIIVAGDARASGMTFKDASEREVRDFGTLPVLIKRTRVKLELNMETDGEWTIVGLDLNGTRGTGEPVAGRSNRIALKLDNATSQGPTTFWVLEKAKSAPIR